MCLCGGCKKTQVRLKENASTFRFKRTCVFDKMYLRFDSNAEAFYWKRTCVFGALENRLKRVVKFGKEQCLDSFFLDDTVLIGYQQFLQVFNLHHQFTSFVCILDHHSFAAHFHNLGG